MQRSYLSPRSKQFKIVTRSPWNQPDSLAPHLQEYRKKDCRESLSDKSSYPEDSNQSSCLEEPQTIQAAWKKQRKAKLPRGRDQLNFPKEVQANWNICKGYSPTLRVELPAGCAISISCHPCWSRCQWYSHLWVISTPLSSLSPIFLYETPIKLTN